jgi:PAS domain S-box-containing protein
VNGDADEPAPVDGAAAPRDGTGRWDVEDAYLAAWAERLRYQELFEFAGEGYLITDRQGVIHEANLSAVGLLQSPKAFLLGKPLGFFVAAPDRSQFFRWLAGRRGTDRIEHWEAWLGPPHRKPRCVAMTVTGVEGSPSHALRWALRDVTQAREAQLDLAAERNLLENVVETTEAFIVLVGRGGKIERSNHALQVACGYTSGELRGREWANLLPEAAREPAAAVFQEALARGAARTDVLEFVTQDGASRGVVWSARRTDGDPAQVILLGYDVTELREAQDVALRTERLAAIGQMAAGVAHESRNALQRASACVAMLAMRLAGQSEMIDLLDRVRVAHDDLRRIFDDVQTYSAVLRLNPAECDLAAVWREAWIDLDGVPGRDRAELVEDRGGVNLRVRADRFHLKRVFRNIMENALASGADPVCVTVRCQSAELAGRGAVRVSLRDNGPGFPHDARKRLFEPFFTTKTRGTGLGLAQCRRVVEAHGGRVGAGEDGPGAEIIITLPRRTP